MARPPTPYGQSLAGLTDLYQLTMAFGYLRTGRADHEAVFHLSFSHNPYEGGFAVACGLAAAVDWIEARCFDTGDLEHLASLEGTDAGPLFDPAFLDRLANWRFTCDVDAVPEGTVVFPHEPLVRVRGPIFEAQILETALLNLINFQTLVATKAARIRLAAGSDVVLEFGLRRAQGIDGGLSASRAAYIGGADATSNVLAARIHGIPLKGTHAHSWVLCFDDETEAFREYARALPNNCLFLVDTFDTIEGVLNAITIGREVRAAGHPLLGIRLDSGDLAWLSKEARRLLDEAGFPEAKVVASNDLDERLIASLKAQGAKIDLWGVGTRLVTGAGACALGGVYKLSSVRRPGGCWLLRVKVSEQAVKTSIPGTLQVRRFRKDGILDADVIYDEESGLPARATMVDPLDPTRTRELPDSASGEDLLRPVFRAGRRVLDLPSPSEARARTLARLRELHPGLTRFDNPHRHPVGLEAHLNEVRTGLILQARARHR